MTVDGDEKPVNDRVFMDISIGGLPSGRIVFELFNDVAPKTTENFRALCAGDMGVGKVTGKPLTYKGMVFHRVVKDFMIQGGDFTNANGTGGESIYGGTFEDETFELKHDRPYLLSMANRGKDTNGSQFFITTQPAPHLDNVHVVFGHVVGGAALVRQLEALPVDRNARPLQDVAVSGCGQLVRLRAGKKRKQEKEKEKEDSDADSEHSHKKDKKKKKDKKEKKKKRQHSGPSADEEETTDQPSHPLVTTSKIDPRDIPDVPTNRFLMRGGRDQDNRERNDPRRDRERMRFRERDRFLMQCLYETIIMTHEYKCLCREGRDIERYRTPSRSRSRSRSVTPPHWRQAQRRIIKLSEFERVEQERSEREMLEQRNRPTERPHSEEEGGTPEQPREREEGEIDSSHERSRHEKIDYNALDFEEDVEHEEERASHKRRAEREQAREHARRHVQRPATEHRADMLALALGVQPKHDKHDQHSAPPHREPREWRREAAPRLPSAVAPAPPPGPAAAPGPAGPVRPAGPARPAASGPGLGGGLELRPQSHAPDDYDPVTLLRSTFNRDKKDRGKEVARDRKEEKPERSDRRDKDKDRLEKTKEKEDRRERHRSERDDRESKYSEYRREEKDKKEEKREKDRERSRERDRYKDKSEKRREDERDRDRKKRRSHSSSVERSKSPKPKDRKRLESEDQEKNRVRSKDGDEDSKKKEDERNEARKELMEIVRLIKSRQRDRENKAAEAKKRRDSSDSSSSEEEPRSSDRRAKRSHTPRGRGRSSSPATYRRGRRRSPDH
ncbi:peptidyl-prolyl cis-trans isomerase G [Achroia grisella]|uniref:peptidyl-prolyl cis-trans isomerase G n=1 Tax=Achroia grisella TaxID=688607 RepID=UPI0027D2C882|nr:peptidyl-prolyl cis-trans isomerase G [Achroia grisella]